MPDSNSFSSQWRPRLLSLLRIIIGLLFMPHGAQKLFGFLSTQSGATAPMLSLTGGAGMLEFFGGLFILIGLFTRPVAFILSGLMAFAYFMAHAPQGFWPLQNRGELAVAYCFVFLYMAVAGGGSWSLDHLLQRAKAARSSDPTGGAIKSAA